jgi:DNA replication protein DnaC
VKRVGEVAVDEMARLDRIGRKLREQKAERVRRYGWSSGVGCAFCGDTGTNPETEARCFCAEGQRLDAQEDQARQWARLIPAEFRDVTLKGHPDRSMAREVYQWVEGNPLRDGMNLILSGPVGCGKTGAAIAALRHLHGLGRSIGYWSLASLLTTITAEQYADSERPEAATAFLSRSLFAAQRRDVILLDDLGAERVTLSGAREEFLYLIVEYRHAMGLPILVTTNLKPDAIRERVGERIASRLLHRALPVVVAEGLDYRTEVAS